MCFSRNIIKKYGWCATSIVEDIEYEMILLLNNIRVVFAPEAKVYAEIPNTFKTGENQRGRWDIGRFQIRNKFIPRLILEGIRRHDFCYFDAALELIITPFPLYVLTCIFGYISYLLFGFKICNSSFFIWSGLVSGIVIYVFFCFLYAKVNLKILFSLRYAPIYIMWRVYILLKGKINNTHKSWIKTTRNSNMHSYE
jgi:cellulose synthase/poly-beta-1,6-N-acetylglucosamine synthase-like glycosyltransferase